MNLQFKSLGDHKNIDDLIKYVKDEIYTKPGIKIYVGTDSQNSRRMTTYATVVALHMNENDNGKGAHVLYCREHIYKIKDKFIRLWGEVERSIEVANILREGGLNIKNIDLDLNDDPRWQSNSVLRSAVGYVEASGYKARWKPNVVACRAADALCK
jgi:predicted RNase H-related nuclease YkuK (DUF458 family)